jgi:hypothetical protein
MNTSPTIGEISAALAKAQGEMQNPVKDRVARVKSDKADYTYNYADLANVLDCVRPVLAKHGIAIIQSPEVSGDVLTMHTRLVHSSGEWIESQLSSSIDPQAKIQTLGSAISYLRRYALQAIVGVVAEEDDDGNASDGRQAQTAARPRTAAPPAPPAPPAAAPKPIAAPPPPPDAKQLCVDLAKLTSEGFAREVWDLAAKGATGAAQRTADLKRAVEASHHILKSLGAEPGKELLHDITNAGAPIVDRMNELVRAATGDVTPAAKG